MKFSQISFCISAAFMSLFSLHAVAANLSIENGMGGVGAGEILDCTVTGARGDFAVSENGPCVTEPPRQGDEVTLMFDDFAKPSETVFEFSRPQQPRNKSIAIYSPSEWREVPTVTLKRFVSENPERRMELQVVSDTGTTLSLWFFQIFKNTDRSRSDVYLSCTRSNF